jgi:type II secretory pathway pseudopilin PulG
MRNRMLLAVAAALILTLFAGTRRDAQQSKAEQYIKERETRRAEAASQGDTDTIERVLADDFVGVAPDGSFYGKATEITNKRNDHGTVTVSNQVNDITVRSYGDTAGAQGSETWGVRNANPQRGSYVWTDTGVKRNGKWQVVAEEDLQPGSPGRLRRFQTVFISSLGRNTAGYLWPSLIRAGTSQNTRNPKAKEATMPPSAASARRE